MFRDSSGFVNGSRGLSQAARPPAATPIGQQASGPARVRFMFNLGLALLLIGATAMIEGCNKQDPQLKDSQSGPHDGTLPFLVIYRTPENPLPNQTPISGLQVAVWADGKVLRAGSEDRLAKPYVQGTMNRKEMESLQHLLDQADLPSRAQKQSPVALDVAAIHIVLDAQSGRVHYAESVPLPADSPTRRISGHLYSVELANVANSDFSGEVPTPWRGHQ